GKAIGVVRHYHEDVDALIDELTNLLLLHHGILVRDLHDEPGAEIGGGARKDVEVPLPALHDEGVHGEYDEGSLAGRELVAFRRAAGERGGQGNGRRRGQAAREHPPRLAPRSARGSAL